jgi:glucose/arabinose dehydrogenase
MALVSPPLLRIACAGGECEDFPAGFVLDNGNVWGRPVRIAAAQDGSLHVSDNVSNSIWRISFTAK